MRIQFISNNIENVPTANGGYDKMTVTFKNLESNKIEVKQVMSFASPDVFSRLKDAEKNDLFQISMEKKPGKDGKSYWTWTEIHRDDGTAPEPVATPTAAAPAGKTNTYAENNEINRERLAFDREKQALIIRQSCLSTAVALCKDQGKKPTVAEVLETSAAFENYVWAKGVAGMEDDVPV